MISIEKKYIKNNMHYKNNAIIPVKMLVLHSVGCSQDDPDVFFSLWNEPDTKYLAQMIIGADKVYEVLPCTETKGKAVKCWHVGDANAYSIGAEMTEPSTIKYTSGANFEDRNPEKTKAHVLATYKNAVETFAQLCLLHDLDPLADGVILSHSECHARGIGTNHGDVEHLWKKFGLTMSQFRKDVKSAMATSATTPTTPVPDKPKKEIFRVQLGAFSNKSNALNCQKEAESKGFDTYLVQAGGYFKVQIGAFENKNNALALQSKAKSSGFSDCFITTETGLPAIVVPDPTPVIKKGSKVKVKRGAKTYDGKNVASFVYDKIYTVDELVRDRAVLDVKGLCTAFNVKDLILQ